MVSCRSRALPDHGRGLGWQHWPVNRLRNSSDSLKRISAHHYHISYADKDGCGVTARGRAGSADRIGAGILTVSFRRDFETASLCAEVQLSARAGLAVVFRMSVKELAGGGGVAPPSLRLGQRSYGMDSAPALVGGITLPEATMPSSHRFSCLH